MGWKGGERNNNFIKAPPFQLHRAIKWYNEYCGYNIDCLDLDRSPIDSNSWLAGFSTSKSSFIITTCNRKNSTKVQLNFKLMVNFVFPNDEKEEWYNSVYFSLFSKIS